MYIAKGELFFDTLLDNDFVNYGEVEEYFNDYDARKDYTALLWCIFV